MDSRLGVYGVTYMDSRLGVCFMGKLSDEGRVNNLHPPLRFGLLVELLLNFLASLFNKPTGRDVSKDFYVTLSSLSFSEYVRSLGQKKLILWIA